MFQTIHAKDYTVRKYRSSDTDELFAILSDVDVMKYVEPPFDIEKTKNFLKKYGLGENPVVFALIYDKSKTLIGHVIFHPFRQALIEKEYGNAYELGFVIAKEYWRQGCATAVANVLIDYSRQNNIGALVMECDVHNEPSIGLAKSLGFKPFYYIDEFNCFSNLLTFVLQLK